MDEQKNFLDRQPHLDQGILDGKQYCSYGKEYTRAFRLRQHIEVYSSNTEYRCLVCDKTFGRKDSLRRHEDTKHDGGKVACPGCKKCFRMDNFPKHLASAQRESCRVIAQAFYHQANIVTKSNAVFDPKAYWIPSNAEDLNAVGERTTNLETLAEIKDYREPAGMEA